MQIVVAESVSGNIRRIWLVPSLWVVLIAVFFGARAALGNSMQRMLAEYDLARGGLMGVGQLVMLFSLTLGARLSGASTSTR
jgi:hypothetical protein